MNNFFRHLNSMSSEKRLYTLRMLARHLVDADQLERLHYLLTNFDFIETKCAMGMMYELQADYVLALDVLPEAQEEKEAEYTHEQDATRYIEAIIAYATAWNTARKRHAADPKNYLMPKSKEIPLPAILPSIPLWTDDQIEADTERIVQNPTRLDRIRAFSDFVTSESHNLAIFAKQPGFCLQQAHNHADSGPVVEAAEQIIHSQNRENLLLQNRNQRAPYNFRPALVRTLETQTSVVSVSVAGDGKIVVAAGEGGWDGKFDYTPCVWNLATGELLQRLRGHTGKVNCICLTPDGKIAVSGSVDKTLRVWDLSTGQCLRELEGHTDKVWSVNLTPDGSTAVSVGMDRTLRVWDLDTGKNRRTFDFHPMIQLTGLSITPDGKTGVLANNDGTLRVWDLSTGQSLRTLTGDKGSTQSISITPDGKTAVSSGTDNTLGVWDLSADRYVRTLQGHEAAVTSVSITPDGKIAVSGSVDKTLRVWDLSTGQCLRKLEGHTDYVQCVGVTPDGRTAVSGGKDETLRVWNLITGQSSSMAKEHEASVEDIRLSPNGTTVVSCSADQTLRLWDTETTNWFRVLEGHTSEVLSVAMMPYDPKVVSGGADQTLRVWDVDRSRNIRTLKGHTAGVRAVSLTPDSKTLVSGSFDGELRVWDLATGECRHTIWAHLGIATRGNPGQGVNSLSVTPDGRIAVSGGRDGTIGVWNIETGKCVRMIKVQAKTVLLGSVSVNVSADGMIAVSGNTDGRIEVWALATGECLTSFEGHSGLVGSISLAADNRIAVSAGVDRTFRVWDLIDGKCLAIFRSPSIVRSVSEIRTKTQLALGRQDGRIAFFTLHGFNFGTPVVTIVRLWFSEGIAKIGHWDEHLTAVCEHCGQRFEPTARVIDAVRSINSNFSPKQSPCLELPAKAWRDPHLLSVCPLCTKPLLFNPFVVDNRKQNRFNIRSLFSRR